MSASSVAAPARGAVPSATVTDSPDQRRRLPFQLGDTGRRINAWRKALGLTLQDLSDKTGISIATLSLWERGGRASPRFDKLQAILDAMGITIEELLDYTPTERFQQERNR